MLSLFVLSLTFSFHLIDLLDDLRHHIRCDDRYVGSIGGGSHDCIGHRPCAASIIVNDRPGFDRWDKLQKASSNLLGAISRKLREESGVGWQALFGREGWHCGHDKARW